MAPTNDSRVLHNIIKDFRLQTILTTATQVPTSIMVVPKANATKRTKSLTCKYNTRTVVFQRKDFFLLVLLVIVAVVLVTGHQDDVVEDSTIIMAKTIEKVKLELWSRGGFSFAHLDQVCHKQQPSEQVSTRDDHCQQALQHEIMQASTWLGPVRKARLDWIQQKQLRSTATAAACHEAFPSWMCLRGGGRSDEHHDTSISTSVDYYQLQLQRKIQELGQTFGPDFLHAIDMNQHDHDEDCRKSCELFYCANNNPSNNESSTTTPTTIVYNMDDLFPNNQTITSLSMGAVPPEDFADLFG